ncbi:VirB4 family type IV secretion/conjugal transfer ATPase [Polynucleobacter sp. JS-Safj-400b-B2]|uniref:VirB4 family type IV secretion/conjugal transfer ATPase n=1 Tax=Polynucleobacter sp. JS-Safj-400b-B2 TaxID=2576921 RepID=UPI001C0B932F|nr:VirB4 family type IV secretion/conjugal transfer ATPase [Polynucleobacter sp. JS-Safj-400b-B2]MBU3626685.1 VirB4 family type IV secretion/conjugal transfer ATPase [Polynucleobacter sp. JS-Safj-400b-B2]
MTNPINNDPFIGKFVPFSCHVEPTIVKNRDGSYCSTLLLAGIAFETQDPDEILHRHNTFSNFVKSLGGDVALWSHRIRSKISDRLSTEYENHFVRSMAEAYYGSFNGYRMKSNQFYLTIVYKPARLRSKIKRFGNAFRDGEQIGIEEAEDLRVMQDLLSRTIANMRSYSPQVLSSYERSGELFSENFSFYKFLTDGTWQPVRVLRSAAYNYLASARITSDAELIELKGPGKTRYAAMLDLLEYPMNSEPGTLNSLLYSDFEFIETQSFTAKSKPAAQKYIETQQGRMISSEDAAHSQIEELTTALDDLISGRISFGEYHYSLAIFGNSPVEARKNIAEADAILKDSGFITALADISAEFAWLSQMPGNFRFRPRNVSLSNRNFCGLSCFHGFYTGKRQNNPWGEAVTLLKTPNASPLYFNFHYTPLNELSYDKKAPANTTLIGATGTGKTVTEVFLLLMADKYYPTVMFFDNKRGAEIAIRLNGGNYRVFKRGVSTGLNPFHLPVNPSTILFLIDLVKSLVPRTITPTEHDDISRAVNEVMRSKDMRLRCLSSVYQQLLETSEDSISAHLRKWCHAAGGNLAWVLDNPQNEIDIYSDRWNGFDDTDLVDYPEVLGPITDTLLFMADTLIDGRRYIYVMAEFWIRLGLPRFADFATTKQYTIRSKNGFGVFDTQSPAQILKTSHTAAIVEQTPTQIYLPNPKADRSDYINGFKVTQAEFDIISTLSETSRQFLIKQGGSSSVATLDLGGLDAYLDVLSASLDDVALLDVIRAEVGDNPDQWLPVFRASLRDRKNQSKLTQQRIGVTA